MFGASQPELGQAESSQAEPSTSSAAFTKLPDRISFIALMGQEDSRGLSDSAIKKLSDAVTTIIDIASVGQLFNMPAEKAAEVQTIAVETVPGSVEMSTLPAIPLLIEEPICQFHLPYLEKKSV